MVLNAHSLIYLVLFLQVLLCLAGAFDLTWREYIRLAIISAVLLFLYPRFRKYFTGQEGIREQEADRSSRNHSQSLERYFPQILALTFTFLITQFNPATGQASHLVPQTQLNWFFACSTGLIALAFGLFIYSSRRISPWHTAFRPFDNLDKLVLGVCSFALLLSIGSELVFSSVSPSLQVWTSSIIVLDFLLLWFLITRLFGKKDSSRTPEEGWVPRIRRAVYELIVLVCAAIVIAGVYRGIETAYYLEKGEGYLDAGEYDQAISEYIRAREINQVLDSDLIRQAYLDDLLMLYGEKKDEGGLNAILEEFDRHFRRKFDRNKAGNLYYDAGFWENAIGHYKAALKGGFVEGEILNKLGICYLNSGQQGGFLTLMEKYKYNPRVDAVRYEDCLFVGHGYVLLGRLDEALTWYEKASRINPKDGYVHYKLGKIRLAQGEIQKAVGHFQEALQIDADFADAHYQRGVCYERLGQERPAAEEYGRAVHILPGHLEGTKALRSLGVFQADSIGTPMLRVDHDLGGYITLLGIDLSASEVILEQSFYITFYWKLSRDFFTASNDGREEDRFSVKIFVRDGDLSFWLTDRNPWYQPAPEDWKIGEVIKQKERFTISVQPMGLRKMGKKLDESTFKRYRIPTHTPCEVQVNLRKEENKKAELYICRIPTDLYIQ